ncbi:MAG: class I SAM-dependent methyltransferase [Microscillaceae bacterium]|nr:class I SAM-dependent methyltransferase [Microscillaceae bacterium]MDW8461115.1 hypothetical protein [Cytophagales bacterium]
MGNYTLNFSKYRIFFLVFVGYFFSSCDNTPEKLKTSENLFATAKLLSDAGKTLKILKKDGLNEYDVYQQCIKNDLDFSLVARFVRAVYLEPNNNYQKKYPQTEWYLERLPLTEFLQILFFYKEDYHKTFMDIGSGNGDKLYAAMCVGFDKAFGIEYEKKLHEVAVEALPNMVAKKKIELRLGDATKMDKSYYQQADFIYMYCPLILFKEKQAELTYNLLKNMRNNTLIYEAGFVYAEYLKKYVTNLNIQDGYKGAIAFKKENDKYFYRGFISHWQEFQLK